MIISIEAMSDKELERRERIKRIKERGISPDALKKVLETAKASNQAREERITQGLLDAAANATWPDQPVGIESQQ
jgi:DNA-binding transcriptional MerR regulator